MKKNIIFFSLLALLIHSNLANAAETCPTPQYYIPTCPNIQTSPVLLYPVPTGGAAGVCPGFYTGPVQPLTPPSGYQPEEKIKTGGAAPIRGYW